MCYKRRSSFLQFKKVQKEGEDSEIPLMGVLGAFVFAAQMINFAIPGTGSSGHMSGGILLAALLGPCKAFLTISSVLIIQAFFFADGGILALGTNIFNMGFIASFIVFPIFYKPFISQESSRRRISFITIIASIITLQIGAFCVVIQTTLSGITELPFFSFLLMMQPIHLAIGIVEGLASASILIFLKKVRPEVIQDHSQKSPIPIFLVSIFCIALITAGFFSIFASEKPDGLEWSIEKVAKTQELETSHSNIHKKCEQLQKTTAFLPDYDFAKKDEKEQIPSGTIFSGIIGAFMSLAVMSIVGLGLKKIKS